MLEKKLSLRSQDDPFGTAHKQSMAQLFFKVFDGLAYCRL